jgi:hypothetical protein
MRHLFILLSQHVGVVQCVQISDLAHDAGLLRMVVEKQRDRRLAELACA